MSERYGGENHAIRFRLYGMRLFEPTETEDPFSASCRGYCPPSVATVAFSETSCGRILPPTACRHLRGIPDGQNHPIPRNNIPGRRCSPDYSCKRRMYFGCPRPGYVQNSQSRPKGTDYLYKCGKPPDTACACRERYGVRQSGLFEGFQVYGRQQPLQGLLPVM